MFIEVSGIRSSKKKEEIVKESKEILSLLSIKKAKNLNVSIEFTSDIDCCGYSFGEWHGNQFHGEIEIFSEQTEIDIKLTLAHELCHIKQYYRRQLKTVYPKLIWLNTDYSSVQDKPWETEAEFFEKYYLQFITKDL